jgi:hypothetical protein
MVLHYMPRKNGNLTRGEKLMAEGYAMTGNKAFAAMHAGVSHGAGTVDKALARPAVQAEIARIQQERLFSEVLPLAVQVHLDVLADPRTPAGARVQAVKLAYDRTLGTDEAGKSKDPHEMTPDELAKALADAKLRAAALEHAKAERARPIVEHEPAPADDVFG